MRAANALSSLAVFAGMPVPSLTHMCWLKHSGLKVVKHTSCLNHLIMQFVMLINVKMSTVVGILTFISMINYIQRMRV